MASRREKLLAASFKGVSFFVTSESQTEAGRKIAIHEYPDSSQRFVEDLGQTPPRFRVQAFVSGKNWQDNSRALENALNSSGPGSLVMPTFGSLNAYALPYTKDASQISVGIITFNIEFATGRPANAPSTAASTPASVFAAGDDARASVQDAFAEDFKEPTFIDSIKTAIGDIRDSAGEVLETIADQIDVETLQKIAAKVQDIAVRAPQLLSNPTLLAQEMIQGLTDDPGVWQLTSLGFGSQGTISSLNVLADYGKSLLTSETSGDVTGSSVVANADDETSGDVPYWPDTTDERSDRNALRRLLARNNRLNALIAMYEQVAVAQYLTDTDLNNARSTTKDRYNEIMLDGTGNADALQSNQTVRLAIDNVRNESLNVLSQKDQEAFGAETIQQRVKTSQFVLSYNLYAEEFTDAIDLTERAAVIRDLNPDDTGISMIGDLTILQSRRGT